MSRRAARHGTGPRPPENEHRAATELIGLPTEFFDHLTGVPKDRTGAG
ncbi:hypothetical protein [Kitasatospora sp. NPDC059571]